MSDIVIGGWSDTWRTDLGYASVRSPDIRPPPQAPFTRRRCGNETESFRIVSDTIVFGQSDRRVFTRRRCRDVQRCLRLVRRRSRSRASFVARRTLQNVNMRAWDTVRLKHIVIQQVLSNVSKNVHQPVINPLFFFIRNISQKEMRRK